MRKLGYDEFVEKLLRFTIEKLKNSLALGEVKATCARDLRKFGVGGVVLKVGQRLIKFEGVYRCDLCGDAWLLDYVTFFWYPLVESPTMVVPELNKVVSGGGGYVICAKCHNYLLQNQENIIIEKTKKAFDGKRMSVLIDGEELSYDPFSCCKVKEGIWWCSLAMCLYRFDGNKCKCLINSKEEK